MRSAPITTGAASRIPLAMLIPCPTVPTAETALLTQGCTPDTDVFDVIGPPAIVSYCTWKEGMYNVRTLYVSSDQATKKGETFDLKTVGGISVPESARARIYRLRRGDGERQLGVP